MHDLAFDLRRLGGLATRTQLEAMGHSARHISAMLDAGGCIRLGRSWVSLPDANAEAMRAVAARGILGGESALRSYRIWVSHHTGTCIATPRNASRLPSVGAGAYRVRRDCSPMAPTTWRISVFDALTQHLPRLHDPRHALASLDSALNRRLIAPSSADSLLARMPRRVRRLHRYVDGCAESGLETLLRLAMVEQGWRVASQVEVQGVGRVDLLVDGWLVIEADGSAWHDNHESIDRDRHRNSALVARGYRWHRFGYDQIMNDLDGCVAIVRALLAGGRPIAA